jgi:hypothetical protein
MTAAFALLALPFVSLLVWASHHPYDDLERSYAIAIGASGVFLFGLAALLMALWRPARDDTEADQVVPPATAIHPAEPAIDEDELDKKWAALLGDQFG